MKRFHAPKWPRLENALSLWVNNALNAQQDITGNILKEKAIYFANQFSINDFHSSDGWLAGFKNRNGLRQFRKQGESASAPPAEQLENERKPLRAFLRIYSLKTYGMATKLASFGEWNLHAF